MSKSKRIFTFKNKRHLPRSLAWLFATVSRVFIWTYRIRVVDENGLIDTREPWPVVLALWHNRFLFCAGTFPRAFRRRCAVIVSASRDGEYAAGYIGQFGLRVVRGSSSRRGAEALRGLRRSLGEGFSSVLTLDGPRGPRYEVQPGAAALSQMCRVPVVPVSVNAPSRWELRSWDRTQIPKPFSKVELRLGEPLNLSEGEFRRDRDAACRALRDAMLAITDDRQRGQDTDGDTEAG